MDDALRVVDELGPTDHDVVIGHDWGAIIAGVLASLPDNPFRKAVLMSVPPIPVFYPIRGLGVRRSLPVLLPKQLLRSWYITYFPAPRRCPNAPPARSSHSCGDAGRCAATSTSPRLRRHRRPDRWTAAISLPLRRLGQVCATTLSGLPGPLRRTTADPGSLLHGDRDGALGVGFADRACAVLPTRQRRSCHRGAGHFLQVDSPEETIEKITGFIGPVD